MVGENTKINYSANFYDNKIAHPVFNTICNFTPASDGKYRFVYATRNLISGKWYVGQHTTKNIDDGYMGSGVSLLLAIKKYGKDNFRVDHCCYCENQKNLDKAEVTYINYFDSRNRGYNIIHGGFGGGARTKEQKENLRQKNLGKKLSEETKRKISESTKGRVISKETIEKRRQKTVGKKRTDEFKRRLSEIKKGKLIGDKNHFYGKKHSEETKKRLSEIHKGRKISEDIKKKISESTKGVKQKQITCPFCGKVGGNSGMKRFHFDHCPENLNRKKTKGQKKPRKLSCPYCDVVGGANTMHRFHFDNCLKNPKNFGKNRNRSEEYKEKHRLAFKNKPIVTCPHCGKQSTHKGAMNLWHFDNCKLKK